MWDQPVDRRVNMAEIGRVTVLLLRSSHSEEFSKPRLIEGRLAARQRREHRLVCVDADDVMTDGRHRRCVDRAQIAASDDRQPHIVTHTKGLA
jgi:hypothetical protein